VVALNWGTLGPALVFSRVPIADLSFRHQFGSRLIHLLLDDSALSIPIIGMFTTKFDAENARSFVNVAPLAVGDLGRHRHRLRIGGRTGPTVVTDDTLNVGWVRVRT
jgi:hypothetical protein